MGKIFTCLRRSCVCLFLSFFVAFPCSTYATRPINVRPLSRNLLIVGDEGVGKSKLASAILGLKRITPIEHNTIVSNSNVPNIRIVEMDIGEFYKPDTEHYKFNKLILDAHWILYVVNDKSSNDVDTMLKFYDDVAQMYCRRYDVHTYVPYQDKARLFNIRWFNDLREKFNFDREYIYGFYLVANVSERLGETELNKAYKQFVNNQRKHYLLDGGNSVPKLNARFWEVLERPDDGFLSKPLWSYHECLTEEGKVWWRKLLEKICPNFWSSHNFCSYNYTDITD